MAIFHTVKQGEHASRIAEQYGFDDFRIIWDHPQNAELIQLRQNPNVLLPGDRLFIPDKERKKEAIATARRHRFRLSAEALRLRMVVRDVNFRPISNTRCELHVEGKVHQLTTDDDGMIEQLIAKTAEHCRIAIIDREVPIEIGHLDPVEELTGQGARLNNLGYKAGTLDDASDPQFRSAIEEFQCDQKLTINGICDAATQAKLKDVHGC